MKSTHFNEIYYALKIDKLLCNTSIRKNSSILLEETVKKFSNKKVIVIGNGPSLLKTDLRDIQKNRKDYVLIASNGFYLYTKENGIKADIYCVEDPFPAEDMKDEIMKYSSTRIFPFDLIHIYENFKKEITFIDFRRRLSFLKIRGFKFNSNFKKQYYWGSTVTYLSLQIAANLSPKVVFLVGCDCNYKVDLKDKIKRNTFLSSNDDVNHFSPNYFKNRRWHDPRVEVMHKAFAAANDFYNKLSIPLYNCSPGTAIKSIKKISWNEAINNY